jgi:hypothetical protein
VVPYVNTLADIIKRYGNDQSLWMAEVGYSTYRKSDGYVSNQYWCTYDYEHTAEYHAVALWRTLTLLLSTEKLAAVAWYEVKDLPPQENVIGDVNNRNLGVDYVGYKPKPAEKALSFFNQFFSQKNRCIDNLVTVRMTLGSPCEIHCFEMEDKSIVVIGWLRTNIKGRIGNVPIGNLKDSRREVVDLSLPAKGITKGVRYTTQGVASPFTGFRSKGGTLTMGGVPLAGGDIVILKLTK